MLAAHAAVLLPIIDAALRTLPFNRVCAWFLRAAAPARAQPAIGEARRIAGVVDAVAAEWPWPGHCLRSALATYALVTWRGIPARLVIGVARDRDRGIAAHAWVECGGEPVLGAAPASVPRWAPASGRVTLPLG